MRALLVDDEPELVFTMQERVELRGMEIDAVTSGAEALALVERNAYDVLVVDLKMPGLGGDEVLGRVRQSHPRLPVILLTGHACQEDGDERVVRGATAFFHKPVDIEELAARMRLLAGEA